MSTLPQTISVKPSKRILKVLGDIEFEAWQCLAELIDNAFDAFLEQKRSGAKLIDTAEVRVSIPSPTDSGTELEVVVEDSGPGMDLDTLNNAVRAGWSSNDMFSKLGLFGMGFNVATARLGNITRILTSRREDDVWFGVEINVDSIGDDFEAPVITEPKKSPDEHGTRVVIQRLKPDRAVWLQRNATHLRQTLGAVYSYLLEAEGFRLWVNGIAVQPRQACAWAKERSVTYGSGANAEQIPAYFPIDELLPPAETCLNCRNWQPVGLGECAQCRSTDLVERTRRVHGWLGVQRYLHPTDFGIDYLRNGRKILRYDKRLFEWRNINDPLSPVEVEYPTELRQGGRIVGEIHIDHVPVNYLKNAFEWTDRSWLGVVQFLRGDGPLLPRRAKQLGYPENNSPIGKLHRAFRRNDPGRRYLIPGNGSGPIHDETRKWAQRFYEGDPEYQTDAIWWEAVLAHEKKKEENLTKGPSGGTDTQGPTSGSTLAGLGLAPGDEDDGEAVDPANREQPAPKGETEAQRLARYETASVVDPSLSGEFGLIELGKAIKLRTYHVMGAEVQDNAGVRTPVLLVAGTANEYTAYVNAGHEVFQSFAADPTEYVLMELANNLRIRADSEMPLAELVAMLQLRHLTDQKLDRAVMGGEAAAALRDIRERMVERVRDNPERAWQFLSSDEKDITESNMITEVSPITLEDARETGEFLIYVPPMFLARLIEEWPEAFLDGQVFTGPYSDVTSAVAKRVSTGKVVGYLYDVARLVVAHHSMTKDELVRARYSLELLEGELAQETISEA